MLNMRHCPVTLSDPMPNEFKQRQKSYLDGKRNLFKMFWANG